MSLQSEGGTSVGVGVFVDVGDGVDVGVGVTSIVKLKSSQGTSSGPSVHIEGAKPQVASPLRGFGSDCAQENQAESELSVGPEIPL